MQLKSSNTKSLVACVIWIIPLFLSHCSCIRFFIEPHQKKCLKNEMYNNQLAVGDYEIEDMPGTIVDMTITDSKGHMALNRENVQGKGKFAVTSDEADYYDLCFTYTVPPNVVVRSQQLEIYVDYRVGVDAKQYEQGAQEEDMLAELERELNRIEDLTQSIIIDFAYLKRREQEMRDTNASTNNRLFYQTIISIMVLLVLAAWQILYLRTFFKARKIID